MQGVIFMKALKEKRISLRSLWRMGLVVLSVFALTLAFAACANTGGEDPNQGGQGGTPGGSGQNTGKVPLALAIEKNPDLLKDKDGNEIGVVHEGQLVKLDGMLAKLYYSDDTWADLKGGVDKFTVVPSIYVYGQSEYLVIYTVDGVPFVSSIPASALGFCRRIVGLDATGRLDKQVWYIDEVPNMAGVTINAYYSTDPTVTPSYAEVNPQAGWYNLPLNFDPLNPDYKWAWVWNTDVNYRADQPGLLLEVGRYGNIADSWLDPGNIPAGDFNNFPRWTGTLVGKKILIEKLIQVKELKWDPQPSLPKIFYDNPQLIGVAGSTVDITGRSVGLGAWRDILSSAKIRLVYDDNTDSKDAYTLTELETRNANRYWTWFDTGTETFLGGTWADGLEMGLFNPKGNTLYDQRAETNMTPLSTTVTWGMNGGAYTDGGGWAQWAALAQPQIRLSYRGRPTPLLEVPVYNRPLSMTITPREEGVDRIIMSGYNFVYRRPEGMNDFLQKVKISVTYGRRSGEESDTAVRDDIYDDIYNKYTCRATYTSDVDLTTGFTYTAPTLFSSNTYDPTYYPYASAPTDSDMNIIRNIDLAYGTGYSDSGGSILTATNATKAKETLMGRVYYFGWAGEPSAYRAVNARIAVLPVGQTFDYD